MSRPLNENEMSIFDTPSKGNGKYDWSLWMNGQAFAEMPKGKPESFKYLLRSHAAKVAGMTVDIRDLPSGEIAFRFVKADEPAEETPETEETAKAEETPKAEKTTK